MNIQTIRRLIAEDKLDKFYTSRSWRKVRAIAFKQYHYECQECKRNKRLTVLGHPDRPLRAGEVIGIGHHKKPLKLYPELALNPNNIEPVCWNCHNAIEKSAENEAVTEEFFG